MAGHTELGAEIVGAIPAVQQRCIHVDEQEKDKGFKVFPKGALNLGIFFNLSWKFMLYLEMAKDPFRSQKKKKKEVQLYNTMTFRSTCTNLTESVTREYLPLAELDTTL